MEIAGLEDWLGLDSAQNRSASDQDGSWEITRDMHLGARELGLAPTGAGGNSLFMYVGPRNIDSQEIHVTYRFLQMEDPRSVNPVRPGRAGITVEKA